MLIIEMLVSYLRNLECTNFVGTLPYHTRYQKLKKNRCLATQEESVDHLSTLVCWCWSSITADQICLHCVLCSPLCLIWSSIMIILVTSDQHSLVVYTIIITITHSPASPASSNTTQTLINNIQIIKFFCFDWKPSDIFVFISNRLFCRLDL